MISLLLQYHYNYVRAAYGIDHFIYILMRYSNHFKLTCCQDEMKITEAKGSIAEVCNFTYNYIAACIKVIITIHCIIELCYARYFLIDG